MDLLPNYKWIPWKFEEVIFNKQFINDKGWHIKYMKFFVAQNNLKTAENWLSISSKVKNVR